MTERPIDELTLDGNAVAGLLIEVFGREMTAADGECASCGNRAPLGSLRAYTRAPGVVLRCVVCTQVVLRLVRTPRGVLLDARGAAQLSLADE